jgi:hypothetical protein
MALSTYPSLQLNMGMVLGGFLFLRFKIESGSNMGSQMPSNFGSRIFFTFKFGQFQVNN